tara:strand:- start:728 stop:1783 length:1056 start_codon:yes stop_codon:yes gene_type:complete
MLVFLEGWYYVMELYFWLILGAILLVSLTILLARPKRDEYKSEIFDIDEGQGIEKPSDGIDTNEDRIEYMEDEEEELDEEIEYNPEQVKKQWAMAFSFGGLTFVMFGGIVLWIGDGDFSKFLGSSMIYVGILSLLKGISFQVSEERIVISGLLPILIFIINFFLLSTLLGVIGQTSWIVRSNARKAGDLFLVYILPYLLWMIVPSFNNKTDEADSRETDSIILDNERFYNLLPLNLKFIFFTYALFWITNYPFMEYFEISFHYPILRQYAKIGLDLGIDFLIVSLVIRIATSINRTKGVADISERTDSEYMEKKETPENLEKEGKAIRDFTEEDEQDYFENEYVDSLEDVE